MHSIPAICNCPTTPKIPRAQLCLLWHWPTAQPPPQSHLSGNPCSTLFLWNQLFQIAQVQRLSFGVHAPVIFRGLKTIIKLSSASPRLLPTASGGLCVWVKGSFHTKPKCPVGCISCHGFGVVGVLRALPLLSGQDLCCEMLFLSLLYLFHSSIQEDDVSFNSVMIQDQQKTKPIKSNCFH